MRYIIQLLKISKKYREMYKKFAKTYKSDDYDEDLEKELLEIVITKGKNHKKQVYIPVKCRRIFTHVSTNYVYFLFTANFDEKVDKKLQNFRSKGAKNP